MSPKHPLLNAGSFLAGTVVLSAGVLLLCFNGTNVAKEPYQGVTTPPVAGGFPPPQIDGKIPVVIPPHDTSLSPEKARPFFDSFSWQSFIALNWPAAKGVRGVPDQPDNPKVFQSAPNGTPVVWGTYKDSFDLFGQGDQRPSPWESMQSPVAECPDKPDAPKVFARLSKGDSVLQDLNEAFSFPLIDQNKNYVWYEVRYNKAFYNFVRGTDNAPKTWLYLLGNLAPAEPVSMPVSTAPDIVGAMMIKAAWREITPADDQSRYYVVQAEVMDPVTKKCVPKSMALVGLHIVQKLTDFPEWIWSTFEQVDNVQRGPGSTPATPISFNNGTDNPQTVNGFANRPTKKAPIIIPKDERTPVQVTRLNPIPTTPAGASTVDLNAAYAQALQGTVWSHYELVETQWPSDPGNFKTMEAGGVYPANCGAAFPANGVTNTTMETYFQAASDAAGAGGNSCMSCHYRAGQSDFSWGLMRRAH